MGVDKMLIKGHVFKSKGPAVETLRDVRWEPAMTVEAQLSKPRTGLVVKGFEYERT